MMNRQLNKDSSKIVDARSLVPGHPGVKGTLFSRILHDRKDQTYAAVDCIHFILQTNEGMIHRVEAGKAC
jgi:hypothetical protein